MGKDEAREVSLPDYAQSEHEDGTDSLPLYERGDGTFVEERQMYNWGIEDPYGNRYHPFGYHIKDRKYGDMGEYGSYEDIYTLQKEKEDYQESSKYRKWMKDNIYYLQSKITEIKSKYVFSLHLDYLLRVEYFKFLVGDKNECPECGRKIGKYWDIYDLVANRCCIDYDVINEYENKKEKDDDIYNDDIYNDDSYGTSFDNDDY